MNNRLLTEEEISRNIDLDTEREYKDGGSTTGTFDVEDLLKAQDAKTTREILKELREKSEETLILNYQDIEGNDVEGLVIPIKVIEGLERGV